ncbi:hypothetical protein D7V77_41090 [Corallococcus sp. CA041A]|nr:hypothetical protein D7V77_41090 [Corallococcus sp. CA041A]
MRLHFTQRTPCAFEEALRTLVRHGHSGEQFGPLVDAQVPLPVEDEYFARVHLREHRHGVGTLEALESLAQVTRDRKPNSDWTSRGRPS